MPAVAHPLRSIAIAEELTLPIAQDQFGTPANFLELAANTDSLSWTPNRPPQDSGELQQHKHGRPTKVHGVPSADVQMTIPLARTGIIANASTASADHDDAAHLRALKIAFGGIRGNQQGSLVASGSSATGFTVTAAQGARFTAGGAIGWVNAAGLMEMRAIKSVSGDAVVLKHALSGTPGVGNTIFNATTIFLDDGGTHAQFRAIGKHTSDAWSIRGAQLKSISFSLTPGAIPTVTLGWKAALWENRGPVTLAAANYVNHRKFSHNYSELQAQVVGTNTRNIQCIREFNLAMGLTYVEQTCTSGVNTIEEFVQQHTPSIGTGSFSAYYNGQTWFNIWDAQTMYMLALAMIDGSQGGVMIELPSCQIGSVTSPTNAGGLAASAVSFETGLDTDATDQSTAIRRSPVKIHILN